MPLFTCLRISDVSLYSFNQAISSRSDLRGHLSRPLLSQRKTPQGVILSRITLGRATPGTRAPRSQPSASPLQELPPAPHPVPILPRSSPPRTAVSSPGSEQFLEAHPPTFLSWERGSKYLGGFSRAGASGQLRVNHQTVQTPNFLEKQEPERSSVLSVQGEPTRGDGELSSEEGRRLGKRWKGVRDVIYKRSNPEEENKARESVVINNIKFI